MMQKVLVIGATGMIGKPVTHELLQAGYPVTIMARNLHKARKIFPAEPIVFGDVFDLGSLVKAMEGQEVVYISLSPPRNSRPTDRMPEREGIENIIAAAKASGIKRLVLLSSLVQSYNNTNGFHWWIFDLKIAAVEKIRASGIPYTVFYPSTFMECFDQLLMQGNFIMLAGKSVAPMYFIAAADYGKQVATSLAIAGTGNREYSVQGEQAFNWDHAVDLFIRHYKKTNAHVLKAPLGMLKLMGRVNRVVRYGASIMEALNNYPEKFESATTWRELGKPTTTIAGYAAGR